MTLSHPPGGRLPLLSARPAVTSSATEHHRPLAGTKLYCLVTEAHRCEQLAQGCYAVLPRVGFEPATTYSSQVQCSTRCTTVPPFSHHVQRSVSSMGSLYLVPYNNKILCSTVCKLFESCPITLPSASRSSAPRASRYFMLGRWQP